MPSQKEVFYPELKEAILNMPQKEKDKLLLRLLVKDSLLVAQLEHKLLKDEDDTQAIFREKEKDIRKFVIEEHSPGLLLMTLRYMNGDITRYEKITKDKFGAIKLGILMLNTAFAKNMKMLQKNAHNSYTFSPYVTKRVSSILNGLSKIHEDYYIEVEDDINLLLKHIYEFSETAELARIEGIPARWEY